MDRRFICAAVALIFVVLGSFAGIDSKFYRKAAEKVWSKESAFFDPAVEIPDSLASGASAVILACYWDIEGSLEVYSNMTRDTNRERRVVFRRVMVKLLDKSAVDEYSEFTIGGYSKQEIVSRRSLGESKAAFGARIYKPDGSLVDVDVTQAYPISDGKNADSGKESKYKLAIPSLDVGDVIEYFYYNEEWSDIFTLKPLSMEISMGYPVLKYKIDGRFAPNLTVEYRTLNGAPVLNRGVDEKNRNTVSISLSNIPVVNDKYFTARTRQLPFYVLYTLNNTSKYNFIPERSRGPGIHANIPAGLVYREIAEIIAITEYSDYAGSKVRGMYNKWLKANPETDIDQKLDALWLATIYVAHNDDRNDYSNRLLAAMFLDQMHKLDIADPLSGMGFVNSRHDVPTASILHWTQPDYLVVAGGRTFMPSGLLSYVPGETSGNYQAEEGGFYPMRRKDITKSVLPSTFKVASSTPGRNSATMSFVAEVTEEGDIDVEHKFELTGTMKRYADFNTVDDWLLEAEDFLAHDKKSAAKNSDGDKARRAEDALKEARSFAESFFIEEPADVSDLEISSRGIVPTRPSLAFEFKARHHSVVSDAGDGKIVKLGRMLKETHRFDGAERERVLDVVHNSPGQMHYNIVLKVPDGYAVDESSLPSLNVNVANVLGMFYAHPEINEEGDLVLTVVERNKNYVVSADRWPEMLQLLDAAADFGEAAVFLRKK